MKTFKDFVEDAKTRIAEISAEELKKKCDACETVIVIDVREECDWNKGHLPNAVHISRGVLELKAPEVLPDRTACIVCYCGGGSRSALAADVLQQMGYTHVFSMAGGFRGWCDCGHPTTFLEQLV